MCKLKRFVILAGLMLIAAVKGFAQNVLYRLGPGAGKPKLL
jgi:hypothetical protein